jgi:hypothetical protein
VRNSVKLASDKMGRPDKACRLCRMFSLCGLSVLDKLGTVLSAFIGRGAGASHAKQASRACRDHRLGPFDGMGPEALPVQPPVGNRHPPVLSHLLSSADRLPRGSGATGVLCPGQHGRRSATHASQHGSHPRCFDSLRTTQRSRLRHYVHWCWIGLPRPFVPPRHCLLPAVRSPAIRLHLLLWAMCRFPSQPSLDSGANL